MDITELQQWITEHYPEDYEFTKLLKYWVNKYLQETQDE